MTYKLKQIITIFMMLGLFGITASQTAHAKKQDVTWNNGLLSVDLQDVEAVDVLKKIEDVMYIEIKAGEGITKKIKSFKAKDKSIKDLLTAMFGGEGFAIVIEYSAGMVKRVMIAKKEGKSSVERKDLKLEGPRKIRDFQFRIKGKFDYKEAKEITDTLLDETKKRKWGRLTGKIIEFTKPEFKPLLKQLMEHENNGIRWEATDAFMRLVDVEDVETVIKLAKSADWSKRAGVVYTAMAYIDDPRFIPLLIELLGDKEDTVRAYAARMLGYRKVKEAVPYLRELLKDKESPPRIEAADALTKITGREYDWVSRTGKPIEEFTEEDIRRLVGRGEMLVSLNAIEKQNNPQLNDILIDTLMDDRFKSDPAVREQAARILGKKKIKKAVSYLIESFTKKPSLLNFAITEALINITGVRYDWKTGKPVKREK